MKDHPRWYDGHLRIRDEGHTPYYGYWAFEAGAAVFLPDFDDSDIDHLVYPKELVSYARKLRVEHRHASVETAPALDDGRVEGGPPCPGTDYWAPPPGSIAVAMSNMAMRCPSSTMPGMTRPSGGGVPSNNVGGWPAGGPAAAVGRPRHRTAPTRRPCLSFCPILTQFNML